MPRPRGGGREESPAKPDSHLHLQQGEFASANATPNATPNAATLDFFYTPHTLSMLLLMLLLLTYLAFTRTVDPGDFIQNSKLGLAVAAGVFGLIGMLQFKDGPFIRPHRAIWRVVLAASVAYLIVLVFILFQSKHDMRILLNTFDGRLGVPLPEKSYADNCDLTPAVIYDQLFDIFVLAHLFGWYAKALILRDYWFCWILSVMFEFMEYSLQHQLPNFAECWWDHWILDLILTNWVGTWLGMKTCEYFEMKHYSWRGVGEIPSYRGKLKRGIQQFTPYSWTKFEWSVSTRTFKNFVAVIGLLFLVLQCELNAFYLKYLLWIPANHPINVYRLALYFFIALPAVREGYQFLASDDPSSTTTTTTNSSPSDDNHNGTSSNSSNSKKSHPPRALGTHAWMGAANVLVELLIIIKYSDGEFKDPAPGYIIWSWIVGISVLVCYAIWTYGGGLREWIGTWSGGSNDVENKEMTTGRGKRNTRQKQSTSSSSSCSSSVLTSSRVAALVSEEDFQTLHHHLDSESPTTRILRKRQKA